MNNQNNEWQEARISVDGNNIHLEKIVEDLKKKVGRQETLGWVGLVIAIVLSIPIILTQFAYSEIKNQNQEIKDQNQEIKDLANLLREQNKDLVSSNKELTERIHQVELKIK